MNNNLIAILALRSVKGVGAAAIKKLWQHGIFDDRGVYLVVENGLQLLGKNVTDKEVDIHINDAKELIHKTGDEDVKMVELSSAKYPQQLREMKTPPSVLFYKGKLERANNPIGIIGTREPSDKAVEIAKRISSHFSSAGYSICNGLALGIDSATVDSGIGIRSNVVGVVAGGLNYNRQKTLLKTTAKLADEVLESGGLIISEYQCGEKEDTYKVVDSCYVQAGLSNGLILIQSKADGGSKFALKTYAEFKRPLGIVNIAVMDSDPSFEANMLLMQNFKSGLSRITGVKAEKILAQPILIGQKADYGKMEEAMRINGETKKNLFE